jgi:hypothetical protein
MRSIARLQSNRFVAGIMAVMMLVVVLFSVTFIVVEIHHDCCGEDCPVCACISQCESILQQFGYGMTLQAAVISLAVILVLCNFLSLFIRAQDSPVSRKVRMNN